jgi:serine/threonine protein kinase
MAPPTPNSSHFAEFPVLFCSVQFRDRMSVLGSSSTKRVSNFCNPQDPGIFHCLFNFLPRIDPQHYFTRKRCMAFITLLGDQVGNAHKPGKMFNTAISKGKGHTQTPVQKKEMLKTMFRTMVAILDGPEETFGAAARGQGKGDLTLQMIKQAIPDMPKDDHEMMQKFESVAAGWNLNAQGWDQYERGDPEGSTERPTCVPQDLRELLQPYCQTKALQRDQDQRNKQQQCRDTQEEGQAVNSASGSPTAEAAALSSTSRRRATDPSYGRPLPKLLAEALKDCDKPHLRNHPGQPQYQDGLPDKPSWHQSSSVKIRDLNPVTPANMGAAHMTEVIANSLSRQNAFVNYIIHSPEGLFASAGLSQIGTGVILPSNLDNTADRHLRLEWDHIVLWKTTFILGREARTLANELRVMEALRVQPPSVLLPKHFGQAVVCMPYTETDTMGPEVERLISTAAASSAAPSAAVSSDSPSSAASSSGSVAPSAAASPIPLRSLPQLCYAMEWLVGLDLRYLLDATCQQTHKNKVKAGYSGLRASLFATPAPQSKKASLHEQGKVRLKICVALLLAACALERRGVVHRDYKLDNIMVICLDILVYMDQYCPHLLPFSRNGARLNEVNKMALANELQNKQPRPTRASAASKISLPNTPYIVKFKSEEELLRRDPSAPWKASMDPLREHLYSSPTELTKEAGSSYSRGATEDQEDRLYVMKTLKLKCVIIDFNCARLMGDVEKSRPLDELNLAPSEWNGGTYERTHRWWFTGLALVEELQSRIPEEDRDSLLEEAQKANKQALDDEWIAFGYDVFQLALLVVDILTAHPIFGDSVSSEFEKGVRDHFHHWAMGRWQEQQREQEMEDNELAAVASSAAAAAAASSAAAAPPATGSTWMPSLIEFFFAAEFPAEARHFSSDGFRHPPSDTHVYPAPFRTGLDTFRHVLMGSTALKRTLINATRLRLSCRACEQHPTVSRMTQANPIPTLKQLKECLKDAFTGDARLKQTQQEEAEFAAHLQKKGQTTVDLCKDGDCLFVNFAAVALVALQPGPLMGAAANESEVEAQQRQDKIGILELCLKQVEHNFQTQQLRSQVCEALDHIVITFFEDESKLPETVQDFVRSLIHCEETQKAVKHRHGQVDKKHEKELTRLQQAVAVTSAGPADDSGQQAASSSNQQLEAEQATIDREKNKYTLQVLQQGIEKFRQPSFFKHIVGDFILHIMAQWAGGQHSKMEGRQTGVVGSQACGWKIVSPLDSPLPCVVISCLFCLFLSPVEVQVFNGSGPHPFQTINDGGDRGVVEMLRPNSDHWLGIMPKGWHLKKDQEDQAHGPTYSLHPLEGDGSAVEDEVEEIEAVGSEPRVQVATETADMDVDQPSSAQAAVPPPPPPPLSPHKRKSTEASVGQLEGTPAKKTRSSTSDTSSPHRTASTLSDEEAEVASTVNRVESVISPRGTVPITGGRTSAQAKGAIEQDEGSAGSQQKTPVGKTKGAQAENKQRRRTRASTQSKTASSQAAAESTRAGRIRTRRN